MRIQNERRRDPRRSVVALGAAVASAALCLGLAGCGASSASASGATVAASATATCPPAATTVAFKTVSGKITSVGSGAITITPATGASVTAQISSTTRITKLTTSSLSAVQVGQVAQVVPDSTGTIAQRITVQGAGGFGRGGTGGFGGASGTPSATRVPGSRFNPACFRRAGQGAGATGGQGGRVSQVSPSQITLTDAQGQTLTYSVTANTVIIAPTAGSAADLTSGATVTVTGQASGSGIAARSIIVTSPAQ